MRPVPSLLALLALVALPLSACDAGGSDPPAAPSCVTSADCPSSMVCEFATADGCGAQGECDSVSEVGCAPQPVCSCTGVTTDVCVIGGYVSAPVHSAGACGDSGGTPVTDAGADSAGDSGSDASAD
jgi:hypothetical protein